MDNIDRVISKLNEILDTPGGMERRDCYSISQTKGPYGTPHFSAMPQSTVVVFTHSDDPNDTQVIGIVVDDSVTTVMWNNDGWEAWHERDEFFLHTDVAKG